jgi:hypothetical protein
LESPPPVRVSPDGDREGDDSVFAEEPPSVSSFLPGFGFVPVEVEPPRESSGEIADGLSPDAVEFPPDLADWDREDAPEEPEVVDSFGDGT